jgi:serine/threonine-protein kinase
MSELQPGTAVTPSIRLERRLGAGGMGSVWIAEHMALRTQVVVKFMAVELAASAEAVERFSREAAAAAQVKSPHVVQMLDHGVTPDGIPFIVMELLEGQDLGKFLAARGRLTVAETAEIIGQVCKALARAHERGIVHRDIKPDNIFLCAGFEGETFVKLLDFGIAKADARLGGSSGTKTGAMIGTPFYMSPEQIVGAKTIDWRTDLWSLGIVGYECVVGTRPFEEEIFGALAIRIHSGPMPVPSEVQPGLPPAFDQWFSRACARDVNTRFASARELADALSRVAGGGSLTSSTPSAGPPVGGATMYEPQNTPPIASSPLARAGTNAGMGLSTLAPRPVRSSAAAWTLAATAAAVVLTIGAVIIVKRTAVAPAPSAAAALHAPSAPASAPLVPAAVVPSAAVVLPPLAANDPPATGEPVADASVRAPTPASAPARPQPAAAAPAQPRSAPPSKPAGSPRPAATPNATKDNEKDIF